MDPQTLAKEAAEATAIFAPWVGVWEADMEIRPGPGKDPLKLKAVSTRRLISGGKWLVTEHQAESGFEGHGILGWDASTKRYTAVWVDNTQAAIARGTGTWDAASKALTVEMEVPHQGQAMRYRERYAMLGEGEQAYTSTVPLDGGKEFEMLKVTYKRRKAA